MKPNIQVQKVMLKITPCLLLLTVMPSLQLLAGPRSLGGEPAPIDGGISLLVAAGIGYGAKKVRDARKKSRQTTEHNDTL